MIFLDNHNHIHLLLQLLKEEFQYNDFAQSNRDNCWIMAAALSLYNGTPTPNGDKPTHIVRLVLRTTDETGTNDYVDGTDVYVRIDQENQIADFVWEDLWAEGPPIFHGGTIPDALCWVRELAEPFYIQLKDPFLTTEQRIALNVHDKDFTEPQFKDDQKEDRCMIDDELDLPF